MWSVLPGADLRSRRSGIRQHEYTDKCDRELHLRPSNKVAGDRYFICELVWKEAEEGYWTLTREDDGTVLSFSDADELLIRDQDAMD